MAAEIERAHGHTAEITVDPNTSSETPKTLTIEVPIGVLTRLHIYIPDGHHALAGLQIWYGIRQLFPYETGKWIRGNATNVIYEEYYELPSDPTIFTLKAYNEDTKYSHTFYLYFTILPKEVVEEWKRMSELTDLFRYLAFPWARRR